MFLLIYLFILISRQRRSSQRDMWPRKEERASGRPRSVRSNKWNPSPSTVRCAQDSGAGVPPYKIEMKRKKREEQFSHLLHAPSLPQFPTQSTRPSWPRVRRHPFHQPSSFPDNSKKRINRLSHLGLANKTRIPPRFFPSHATIFLLFMLNNSPPPSLFFFSYRTTVFQVFIKPSTVAKSSLFC